jgi:hypothetical protein
LEVEPLLFREEDGSDLLAFRADGQGRATHAFSSLDPTSAFEKLAWYESPLLHFPLLGISYLLLLSELAAASIRFFRRRRNPQVEPFQSKWARRLLLASVWLGVLFIPALIVFQGGYLYGETLALNLVLALPVLMLLPTVGAMLLAVPAWKERWWSLGGRIHYSLVVLAAFAYLWFLNFWNMLGWKY